MEFTAFSWAVVAIQFLGMLSALAARINWVERRQALCHRLFFVCLVVVGIATVVSLGLGVQHWLFSGVALAVMSVAATVDLDGSGAR